MNESDQQISNMLRSLVSDLCILVEKKQTAIALATKQVLDALIAILNNL